MWYIKQKYENQNIDYLDKYIHVYTSVSIKIIAHFLVLIIKNDMVSKMFIFSMLSLSTHKMYNYCKLD